MTTRTRYLLTERDGSRIELTEEDVQFLESRDEFTIHRLASGAVEVTSVRHVGVIGLPGEDLLEIEPKAPCNLLHYLAYVDRLDEELVTGTEASIRVGESFVDLIAKLFLSEVDGVLKRGLKQEYLTQESEERYLKGQLELQNQLQRHGPAGTRFECRYDELSREVVENKLLLDAVGRLRQLVDDGDLLSKLNRYYGRLNQQVTHETMSLSDFEEVTINRLHEYYENPLELAELIFQQEYVESLRGLDRQFSSLLINMENTFENVVAKAVDSVVDSSRYDVRTASYGALLRDSGGESVLNLQPDFYIWDQQTRQVVLVGDAKWKIHTEPKREDLYQVAAYQAKYGIPGVLVYPDLDNRIAESLVYDEEKGTAAGRGDLSVIELQTGDTESYEEFKRTVESTVEDFIRKCGLKEGMIDLDRKRNGI